MYHYIRNNPDPYDRLGYNLSVPPAEFAAQMSWLAASGYHPIDLADLRGYLLEHGALPAKPVVITFDDGYRDLYTEAYPVLRAHGFKAVAYIISGFLGSPNNVDAGQVVEMQAHGIEIASHTVSHPDLTKLSAGELRRQLEESKSTLEAILNRRVLDFCYPSGAVDPAVVRAVEAAGYQSATTTAGGNVHSTADRYLWTRVRVSGGESLDQFASSLGDVEPAEMDLRSRQLPAFVPTMPSRPPVMPRLELPQRAQIAGSASPELTP